MSNNENTYCHPDDLSIRFHGVGTPPPWAVDVQPYVAPAPHPADEVFGYLPPSVRDEVVATWDRLIQSGAQPADLLTLLNIFRANEGNHDN